MCGDLRPEASLLGLMYQDGIFRYPITSLDFMTSFPSIDIFLHPIKIVCPISIYSIEIFAVARHPEEDISSAITRRIAPSSFYVILA